jgi:hypothetical protein
MAAFCDAVRTEEFVAHPGAFPGFIRAVVIGYIASIVFLWFNLAFLAWLSLVLGLAVLFLEFVFYVHAIDRFYPAVTGRNVWGVVEPIKTADRTIVFSGHHDSAQLFTYQEEGNPYQWRERGGFATALALLVILTIINVNNFELFNIGFPSGWRLVILLLFTALGMVIKNLWYFLQEEGTPGAGDVAKPFTCQIRMSCGSPVRY